MSKDQHQPHDRLIKFSLSKRKVALQYLKQLIPKMIVEQLDLRTLRKSPTSYVDEKLKEYISDIVYECQFKNNKEGSKFRISFLFEHKSYLPQFPHIQLLRYILETLESDAEEFKRLNLTIPLVLYHGKQKWKYKSFDEYFDLPNEVFKRFIPQFEYLLTDLSRLSDEDIEALEVGFLKNTLMVLKHSREKQFILENLEKVFMGREEYIRTEEGRRFLFMLNSYIFQTTDFDENELILYFRNIPVIIKEIAMSTEERILKKGREEGIELGVELGVEKVVKNMILKYPDYSDAKIADFAGVPMAIVAKIRKSLNGKEKA